MTNGIEAEAARIRASGAFSRSPSLLTLFDFLVSHATLPQTPKDVEIAYRIFGENAHNAGTDSQVRVHVHRLRTKLMEFYLEHGPGPAGALSIPKGEYRLVLTPYSRAAGKSGPRFPRSRLAVIAGLVIVLAAAAALYLLGWERKPDIGDVWKPYVESSSSVMILVGDKAACSDPGGNAAAPDPPPAACQGPNANAHIIPESIAGSMHYIDSALVNREPGTRFRIVMASEAIPEMMRKTNVVYIGLIEDLGILGLPLADVSVYARNWKANAIVVANEKPAASDGERPGQSDFGYIASFPSADGNRVVIAAGTSNAGIMQAAETLANPAAVKQLEQAVHGRDFEAVFRVNRINQTNMGARLIAIRPFAGT